jgi:hypothetical protein
MPDGTCMTAEAAPRIRKAWAVWVPWCDRSEIYYGPNAGKVRAEAWLSLSDSRDLRIIDVRVRRAGHRDQKLPPRHPIADHLTKGQLYCLLHAFGGNDCPYRAGNRDYFYATRDDPELVALTKHGLMKPMDGDRYGENMTYFVLTKLGKHVALSLVRTYRNA